MVYICGLFHDAVNKSNCIAFNCWVLINGTFQRVRRLAVVASFYVKVKLSRYRSGEALGVPGG
jgi:hypothetical protein